MAVEDTSEKQRRLTVDDRTRAAGVAKDRMRRLEVEMANTAPLGPEAWLILDGSVEIAQYLAARLPREHLVGVSKSFSGKLLFRVGRQRVRNLTHLLSALTEAHRTPAFLSLTGTSAFWYVRLRPQGLVDYPLMRVVKVDMLLPEGSACFDTALITEISQSLVAERTVTPYGRDAGWHAHLYPIYAAEQALRSRFLSTEMLKEGLAAQWRRLLMRTE